MVERHRLQDEDPRSADVRIQSEGSHEGTPDAAHEMTDAHVGSLFQFALWLSIGVGIVLVSVGILFFLLLRRGIAADPPLHPLASEREIPPEPRLQALSGVDARVPMADGAQPNPLTQQAQQDWAEHLDASRKRLSSYGWVDRPTGVVHIPIERAIELALQKGPATAPSSSGSSAPPEKR